MPKLVISATVDLSSEDFAALCLKCGGVTKIPNVDLYMLPENASAHLAKILTVGVRDVPAPLLATVPEAVTVMLSSPLPSTAVTEDPYPSSICDPEVSDILDHSPIDDPKEPVIATEVTTSAADQRRQTLLGGASGLGGFRRKGN